MRRRFWVLSGAVVVLGLTATVGVRVAPARAAASPPNAKINHIVVLMQENRSFDSYFGQLHFEGQPGVAAEPTSGNPNPLDPSAPPIKPFHKTNYCETSDLNHSWEGTHAEFDGGKMDGFTAQNDIHSENSDSHDPAGRRTMGFYDQSDLPFYYALANTFPIGADYFASVLGPTYPNRFYLYAGTSFGHITNDNPPASGFTQPTILRLLSKAGISWKIYFSEVPFAGVFSDFQQHATQGATIAQYYADAKAGTLPQVSFVDPIFIGAPNVENDEHPPSNIQVGEQFSANVINALMAGPNWHDSALFFTYDEHGGFYDHVPPPRAVPPGTNTYPGTGLTPDRAFDNYGIRVPAIVVSPYARPHYVSKTVHDHTSILKFIETRFDLPSLTARDAAANPMLEFFDFAHPPAFATPPGLPAAPLDPAHVLACQTGPDQSNL